VTESAADAAARRCPSCGEAIAADDAFCESCGATLRDGALPAAVAAAPGAPAPAGDAEPSADGDGPRTTGAATTGRTTVRRCAACGGEVLEDGFCGTCGQRALSERDHWSEYPAAWIGGVCDKGIVHARNEDAMALAATPDGRLGVLVVCDGVTTAPDSDRAALGAARAACAQLLAASPAADADEAEAGVIDRSSRAVADAALAANAAAVGVAHALGNPPEPPSCTFVAAVVAGDVLTVGWCGDSRAYWLPDGAPGEQLTIDHSLGTEMIAGGMSREDAEAEPSSHTITRWLGADSIDANPEVRSLHLDGAGWVVVCSDGLWNYASEPATLAAVIAASSADRADPVASAAALVEWANGQGGHDNVTAALARYDPSLR
jgi:serine/threonine protein phosphatase PrpC